MLISYNHLRVKGNAMTRILTIILIMLLFCASINAEENCAHISKFKGLDRNGYVSLVDAVNKKGAFTDTWESLSAYEPPEWYKDAKFGIFIHWGVYSVPGYMSEWYPKEMYDKTSIVATWYYHRKKYGAQDKFGYKDFIPMFKAEKFDADEWMRLFKKAGARYVIPVAEHHDGFAMYNGGFSKWNAFRMGPRRDILGELKEAAARQDVIFGLSSHRAAHWWFLSGGREFRSDVNDPRYASFYGPAMPPDSMPDEPFMRDWLARCAELVDLYKPAIFYFDFGIGKKSFEPYNRKFAAYYYNRAREWGREVVINYKGTIYPEGTAVLDHERTGETEIRPEVWQTDTSVSFISWGYIDPAMNKHKTADRLIDELVDTVSKNGVFLMNIGPAPDGTIPDAEKMLLLQIGDWLDVNGEAIYGTRPWKIYGEGPTDAILHKDGAAYHQLESRNQLTSEDIRFTTKGKILYAVVMEWPDDGAVEIESLGIASGLAEGTITSVQVLGGGELDWSQGDEKLTVSLPPERTSENAFALKIKGAIR